jgi:hypothetical protein
LSPRSLPIPYVLDAAIGEAHLSFGGPLTRYEHLECCLPS